MSIYFLVLLVLIFLVLRTIGSTEVIQSESEQSFSNLEGIQILIWLSLYLFLIIQICLFNDVVDQYNMNNYDKMYNNF